VVNRVALRYDLETSVETRVVRDAKQCLGLRSLKLSLRYDAGWPDRVFLLERGRVFWVEFKRPGDPPRPLQEKRHAELRELGHDVAWFDDYDAAMAALKGRLAGLRP
jgi:hypothetical protein